MKYLIALLLIVSFGNAMDENGRVIGGQINEFDKNNMITITYETSLLDHEIVAVNTNGKWVYGWVQSKPELSNGIWLGVVNWVSPINDVFRGQVRNFSHAVRKLPDLENSKMQKTE